MLIYKSTENGLLYTKIGNVWFYGRKDLRFRKSRREALEFDFDQVTDLLKLTELEIVYYGLENVRVE